ncbi:SMC5-like protein [Bombardia bombarda]|uniref:Structural maintenance of chromosomes protein 5 n=1 Tax=Bombardia bombarda TaxID=252184 RepID=A0AA39WI26_9PEZI|nr:SMC5-like protein [Bombardia bombarda]
MASRIAHCNPNPQPHLGSKRNSDSRPALYAADDDDSFRNLNLRGGDGSQGYDDEEPPGRRRVAASASRRSNGLSSAEFQPGAILRVKLENFVTYEKAEFTLGPNLNMVIGPNGTGKSSLVCAICLGLGYNSSVLGRASAYGEFVKHGKDESEIEIELQKRPGDADNFVVGLCIRREDNSRKFTINSNRATLKDIQQLMKSLRIQIDNLCQFLPQDKVAEFAGLSPVDLLEKTLQAAAPQEMIKWQKDLKEYFKEQKDAQRITRESNEHLRKMEARQQVLQADVEKLRERKEIQTNIATLEKVRLIVKYNEARRQYGEIKKQKKESERHLKRLQDSAAPSLQAVDRKQDYQAKVQTVVEHRKVALRSAESTADEAVARIEAAESQSQELSTKHEAEKAGFAAKKQELARLRKKITDMEASYKQAPKSYDPVEHNRKIREQEHLQRDKGTEAADAGAEAARIRSIATEKNKELKKLLNEIALLESQQGQLLNQLRRISPDVAKGWEWLRENQGNFDKEVFGPPILTCSVNDSRYSDLVQSVLQQDDFLCFTAQTREDHKKLSDQFYGSMGLSVTIRSCFTAYSSFKPPLPKADLVKLGLDGYVTDYLDGPEPVLAMLCSEKRLHASAVSLSDISDKEFESIEQSERISQFAAGKQLYRITRRREYGPGAVSTRVTQFQKGRFWADQPSEATEQTDLRRKLDEIKGEIGELKVTYDEKTALKETLDRERDEIRELISELRKQKNELQREWSKWQATPDKIEADKKAQGQKQEELAEAKARVNKLVEDQHEAVLEKVKAVLRHEKTIANIRNAYQALLEVQILLIEAKSDVAALKEKNKAITEQLEASKSILKDLADRMNELHRVATEAREEVNDFLQEENREELLALAKDKTLEDVSQEISAKQAELEVIQAGNPYALEEFENWAAKIERERLNHTNQEARLVDLNDKIDRVRTQWEPRVDELVSQINNAFSYNFEQISCAGEVGVHKDEDFDKWAIEIRVKFRENETLQRLDQHRQSGGERAVSTIFYLMSLQSMAQAPFRVVDEINQGMDPRNERMVHERMVEIACCEHTSQYFLITPKLLPDLRYDKRMRVHTIVSGEYVDNKGTEKMNFAKFAQIQRQLMA